MLILIILKKNKEINNESNMKLDNSNYSDSDISKTLDSNINALYIIIQNNQK